MKKINGILIVIMLLSITIPGLAVDKSTVVNTVHNLSTSGPGDIKSSTENKVCVFCHTPHNSNPAKPLWNHTLSGQTYNSYNSSTLDTNSSSMTSLSGTTTKLCLSCHDGTIALGDLANMNISVSDSSGSKLDADESLANTASTNLGTDLSDDHPVLFKPEGDFEVNTKADGVKLYDDVGYLQCTSCHNPHNNTYDNFLVRDNTDSALCTTCHEKTGWTASVHDQYLSCGDCHTPHNANEPVRLKAASEEKLCYQCHDDSGSRYSEWTSIPDIGSVIDNAKASGGSVHPIEDADLTGRHDALENNSPNDGIISPANKHSECSDCHDPHQVTANNPLVGIPSKGLDGTLIDSPTNSYDLCYKCHQGTDGVQESINSVEYVFNNRTYTHGNGTGAEQCNKCHGGNSLDVNEEAIHGSSTLGLLTKNQFADVVDPSNSLCLRCHDSAINGQQPKIYFTQANGSQHPTKCTACHGDSVNRNNGVNQSSQTGVPHGSNVSSILKGKQPDLCYDCHSSKKSSGHNMAITNDSSTYNSSNRPITNTDGCAACHTSTGGYLGPHGTDNSSLLMVNIDSNDTGGACNDCHNRPSGKVHTGEDHPDADCVNCHVRSPHDDGTTANSRTDINVNTDNPIISVESPSYLVEFTDSTLGSYRKNDCVVSDTSGCGDHDSRTRDGSSSGGSDGGHSY
ncbi:MAG: cytochrome C family protein [Candidatus Frackibacter sp. T328-2]|nr:MAG: cytochrome C family protein [Candidatus Frackibacter sp. T328-2]